MKKRIHSLKKLKEMTNRPNLIILLLIIFMGACKTPALIEEPKMLNLPAFFGNVKDTTSIASLPWRNYFKDPLLQKLIDTALTNNQELLMVLQEIEMARNDIRVRQGMLLPFVTGRGGAGIDKVGRYTSQGAGDASTDISPGKKVPDWLTDQVAGAYAHWEIDIWKKLRNARQAAVQRYLATVEGKNFVITSLVSEIAGDYYELLALDNQLEIVRQSITLLKNALEVIRIQKEGAMVNELAVKKFEAEVLNYQGQEFEIIQKIRETENEINFLLGRYPQPIERDKTLFINMTLPAVNAGIPSQLLQRRPDIRQAEMELAASRLDVKVARAEFYPSLELNGALGLNAFRPDYLVRLPESMIFSLASELTGPIFNRSAISAEYRNANARQIQSLYHYQQTIVGAMKEVSTELSRIEKLQKIYELKSQEVEALSRSIDVSNELFKYARADYLEVLMTQRDGLESRLELIETRLQQMMATTHLYKYLGGGWN